MSSGFIFELFCGLSPIVLCGIVPPGDSENDIATNGENGDYVFNEDDITITLPSTTASEYYQTLQYTRWRLTEIAEDTILDPKQLEKVLHMIEKAENDFLSLFDYRFDRRQRTSTKIAGQYLPTTLRQEIQELLTIPNGLMTTISPCDLKAGRSSTGSGTTPIDTEEKLLMLCLYLLWTSDTILEVSSGQALGLKRLQSLQYVERGDTDVDEDVDLMVDMKKKTCADDSDEDYGEIIADGVADITDGEFPSTSTSSHNNNKKSNPVKQQTPPSRHHSRSNSRNNSRTHSRRSSKTSANSGSSPGDGKKHHNNKSPGSTNSNDGGGGNWYITYRSIVSSRRVIIDLRLLHKDDIIPSTSTTASTSTTREGLQQCLDKTLIRGSSHMVEALVKKDPLGEFEVASYGHGTYIQRNQRHSKKKKEKRHNSFYHSMSSSNMMISPVPSPTMTRTFSVYAREAGGMTVKALSLYSLEQAQEIAERTFGKATPAFPSFQGMLALSSSSSSLDSDIDMQFNAEHGYSFTPSPHVPINSHGASAYQDVGSLSMSLSVSMSRGPSFHSKDKSKDTQKDKKLCKGFPMNKVRNVDCVSLLFVNTSLSSLCVAPSNAPLSSIPHPGLSAKKKSRAKLLSSSDLHHSMNNADAMQELALLSFDIKLVSDDVLSMEDGF